MIERPTPVALVALVVVAVAIVGTGAAAGCTTFNNARPLDAGQHAVSLTLGGPLTNVPGAGTITLPNATLEGRSGLRPFAAGQHLDVNYGLHLLPLAFGVAGGHVGATIQFFDQPNDFVPALSLGQRFFFFTNIFDPRKARHDGFAMSQTDLTVSWEAFHQLLYAGATAYLPLDAGARTLRLAPFAGLELKPLSVWDVDWLRLQLETRWLAPDVDQSFAVVDWVSPGDRGAVAVNVGVGVVISDLVDAITGDHNIEGAAFEPGSESAGVNR